jgi:hypothetical protein
MPGLILPPFIEPTVAQRHKVLRCNVCGTTFPLEQEATWVRHCRDCANRNEDLIEAEIAEGHSDLFRDVGDKELYQHLRKGGN